jgi:hypothetical protein
MTKRIIMVLALFMAATVAVVAGAADQPKKAAAPDITGEWTGKWGPYEPPGEAAAAKKPDKHADCTLECKVVAKDGAWEATFEGECGRPYKYTIKMEGRQAGEAVLFKGTTDLGEKDGGVFDWIGRATDKEFVGFYTSAKYSGVFRMTRKK